MAISFIMTDSGALTIRTEHKTHSIARDHPNYSQIKIAIRDNDEAAIDRLGDMPAGVTAFTSGQVVVQDGVVHFRNKPLVNVITQRILALMQAGLPFQPMVLFLENLMLNPSYRAVTQLYQFLEHQALPITTDGHFLAYKRVNPDWKDFQTNKLDNSIGQTVSMERNQVDEDPMKDCSAGLHVGAISYVKGFNALISGHIIVTKVNPRDVVSVPTHDTSKIRVCQYTVLAEYHEDLVAPLYASDGSSYTAEGTPAEWSPEAIRDNAEVNEWAEEVEEDDDDQADELTDEAIEES